MTNKAAILLSTLLLLAACRSPQGMYYLEYFIDEHKPFEEIGYEQLPEAARAFHDRCHTPDDIEEIYCGYLEDSGKKAYGINFRDGSQMLFDKNGRCLLMVNLRDGLPRCWTNQIPLYNVIYRAIEKEMAQTTDKPWEVRILEVHRDGYLVKTGQGVDITQFFFDKRGRLKDIAYEI